MTKSVNVPEGWDSIIARLRNKEGADGTVPAYNYPIFIGETTAIFVAKSTDYDDRYLRALIELDAQTIWKWEVAKKLDRLRTWLRRGELQVQSEGIRNSVDDLFIYTVQYVAYFQTVVNDGADAYNFLNNVRAGRIGFFTNRASKLNASEWIEFLVDKGLIQDNEYILQLLLQSYMGVDVPVGSWQSAIKNTLKG